MVVNSLNWESLDEVMEYVRANDAIEQVSINFHTPFPGTEYLMLPPAKKAELIDKVLSYKKKGYPIMNSASGLRKMKRNTLGQLRLGKECFVSNFIYPDGSEGLCTGYGTSQAGGLNFHGKMETCSIASLARTLRRPLHRLRHLSVPRLRFLHGRRDVLRLPLLPRHPPCRLQAKNVAPPGSLGLYPALYRSGE